MTCPALSNSESITRVECDRKPRNERCIIQTNLPYYVIHQGWEWRVPAIGFHLEFSCCVPRLEGPSDGHPGVKWAVRWAPHMLQPELSRLLLVLLTGLLSMVLFERVQRLRSDLGNH